MAGKVTQQRSLLEISTDALCLAVSTALRLAVPAASDPKISSPALLLPGEPLPEISLDQVSWHDNSSDCWIVVYDRVYDVTQFLFEHPGGEEVILEYAGRDATFAFRGTGHSTHAWRALDKYLIGELPLSERIFKSGSGKLFENAPFASSLTLSAGAGG